MPEYVFLFVFGGVKVAPLSNYRFFPPQAQRLSNTMGHMGYHWPKYFLGLFLFKCTSKQQQTSQQTKHFSGLSITQYIRYLVFRLKSTICFQTALHASLVLTALRYWSTNCTIQHKFSGFTEVFIDTPLWWDTRLICSWNTAKSYSTSSLILSETLFCSNRLAPLQRLKDMGKIKH